MQFLGRILVSRFDCFGWWYAVRLIWHTGYHVGYWRHAHNYIWTNIYICCILPSILRYKNGEFWPFLGPQRSLVARWAEWFAQERRAAAPGPWTRPWRPRAPDTRPDPSRLQPVNRATPPFWFEWKQNSRPRRDGLSLLIMTLPAVTRRPVRVPITISF